jgi:hypothetical protein
MVALDEISGRKFLYFFKSLGQIMGGKAHSLWNLTVQRKFDDIMKSNFKKKYMDWKEKIAIKRAEIALKRGLPR